MKSTASEITCNSFSFSIFLDTERNTNSWRYAKPTSITDGNISHSLFSLRDGTPPEQYLSLFHSSSHDITSQIQDACEYFSNLKFKLKNKSGFIKIDMTLAEQTINKDSNEKKISFKDEGYPHIGLYYHTENIVDIARLYTTLEICSELFVKNELELYELVNHDD